MLKMGCGLSKDNAEAGKISRDIDRQIKTETKAFQEQIKLLLLGAGESGKSTIVKQMVIIHKNGFSEEEVYKFRPIVFGNVLQCMLSMVVAMNKLGIQYEDKERENDAGKLLAAAAANTE
uniref:G-protein alpha subunit n=2 Tax=Ciona intestinalis TaxID=7719 RepID=H2XPF9_CIOIN